MVDSIGAALVAGSDVPIGCRAVKWNPKIHHWSLASLPHGLMHGGHVGVVAFSGVQGAMDVWLRGYGRIAAGV